MLRRRRPEHPAGADPRTGRAPLTSYAVTDPPDPRRDPPPRLPAGRAARPGRGPARTPGRRPLPLAGGPRRPAHRRPGPRPRTRWPAERLDALPGAGPARRAADRAACTPAASASPVWRGERAFSTRRDPGQEHAVLRVREADGTERVLVDPIALDPAGTTTLDAWSPSMGGRPAGLPAVHRRRRGVPALRARRRHRRASLDGPIDRCRYSPVAWLPGGEELLLRAPARPGRRCPPARSSSTAGSGGTGSAPTRPTTTSMVHGDGQRPDHLLRRARVSRDGRWLVVSASAGTAPRDDVWIADLAGDGALRDVPGRRRRPDRAPGSARDGRLWLHDRPRRPALAARRRRPGRPGAPGADAWQDVVPQQPDAVLSDVALVDGAGRRGCRCSPCTPVDATDRLSLWAADGSGPAGRRRRASAPAASPGSTAPPGGRDDGLGRLHRLRRRRRRCCAGTPTTRPR